MNRNYNIRINEKSSDYIKFSIWSSPNSNNINFIKDDKNKSTLREYATADVYLDNKIDIDILNYFKEKGLKNRNIAYLSYIEIKKIRYRNNKTYKTFTIINKHNTIKTSKRNLYYNKRNNEYIISKGYGKILLKYIELYLKEKGILYLALIPSSKKLIKYYENIGYILDIKSININENNIMEKYSNYISPNIFMYKKL
jgi:hypothetical protein